MAETMKGGPALPRRRGLGSSNIASRSLSMSATYAGATAAPVSNAAKHQCWQSGSAPFQQPGVLTLPTRTLTSACSAPHRKRHTSAGNGAEGAL